MEKKIKFVDLSLRPKIIDFKINSLFKKITKKNNYIMGEEVNELEKKLKKISDSKYSITCSNGTDALILSLMALDVSKNDTVLVPSYTFAATAESIAILGAKPFFIDISKKSLNIDTKNLEKSIKLAKKKNKIKCMIVVDLFGNPCNYNEIKKISKKYNLPLIIDSAQSFGSKYNKKSIMKNGKITITSFFPTKPLGCFGDGGAIFTNSKKIYKKILSLRNHGCGKSKYENIRIGMNARMDTIQSMILKEKLPFFKNEIKMRTRIAKIYEKRLKKYFAIQVLKKNTMSVFSQYPIIAKNEKIRNDIKCKLEERNIETNIYYKKPLHFQKAYKHYKRSSKKLKNSESISKKILNLPIYPYMNEKDINKITMEVIKYIKKNQKTFSIKAPPRQKPSL